MIKFNELRITDDSKYLIIDASVPDYPYYKDIYIDSICIDTQDTYKDGGPSKEAQIIPIEEKEEVTIITQNDFLPNEENYYTYRGILKEGHYYRFENLPDIEEAVMNFVSSDYNFDYSPTYLNNKSFIFDNKDLNEVNLNSKDIRLIIDWRDIAAPLNNMFFVYVKTKGIFSPDTPCGMDTEYTLGITFNTCDLYNTLMSYIKEVEINCEVPMNFIDWFLRFKAIELSISTKHYPQAIDYYNKFIKDIKQSTSNSCGCHG